MATQSRSTLNNLQPSTFNLQPSTTFNLQQQKNHYPIMTKTLPTG
ncbi:hypothetical protein [Moorena producens]|nr:hypothetical protein [Moorena producens]